METVALPDETPRYRWVVVSLWLLCSVVGYMVISTLGLLLPAVSSDLRLSSSQQGVLSSSAYWGNLALAIPLGWWMSRYSPKMLTTVTMVLGILLLFLQGWAPTFAVLLAGRLAFGITVSAIQPARALLVQQWFHQREIVWVNAISNVIFGVIVGGGLLAAPFILDSLGDDWRMTLYIFGGLFAALTVIWAALGRERVNTAYRSQETSQEVGLLKGALTHRDLWVQGFGFLGVTLAWSAFLSFFPTLMLDTYQVSLKWSGAILALSTVIGGVAGLGLGYVAMVTDKGKGILVVLGGLMTGTYVGMTLTGSIPVLVVLSFLNGITWGFFPILYTVPFHLPGIRPREVAVALAFTTVILSAGTALGPLVTGFLQEALGGLRPALLVISFTCLCLSAAGILLRMGTQRVDKVEHTDVAR